MASGTENPGTRAEARSAATRPAPRPGPRAGARPAATAPVPADRRTRLARGIVGLLRGAIVDPELIELVLGPPRVPGPGPRDGLVATGPGAVSPRPLVPVIGPPAARAAIVLPGPDAVARLVLPLTSDQLAEAYLRAELDIEGDVAAAVDAAAILDLRRLDRDALRRLARWSLELRRGTPGVRGLARAAAPAGSRRGPARHPATLRFDHGAANDFFAPWLDRRLTCAGALFPDGTAASDAPGLLDAAQEARLERICRKLRLGANRRLLDIGSGWGSLVTYAGERHAALAVGVTLSEPQAARAEAQARGAGLIGRVRTEVRPYRALAPLGTFDAVAAVGMAEIAGRADLPDVYRAAFEVVRPGGLVLAGGIVAAGSLAPRPGSALRPARKRFLHRHVVPAGELLRVDEHLALARAAGFDVVDVASLRADYALTLAAWVARLEAGWPEAVAAAGEEVARTWRLHLAAGRLAFERGDLDVCELLLARPDVGGRGSDRDVAARGEEGGPAPGGGRADAVVDASATLPRGPAECGHPYRIGSPATKRAMSSV